MIRNKLESWCKRCDVIVSWQSIWSWLNQWVSMTFSSFTSSISCWRNPRPNHCLCKCVPVTYIYIYIYMLEYLIVAIYWLPPDAESHPSSLLLSVSNPLFLFWWNKNSFNHLCIRLPHLRRITCLFNARLHFMPSWGGGGCMSVREICIGLWLVACQSITAISKNTSKFPSFSFNISAGSFRF